MGLSTYFLSCHDLYGAYLGNWRWILTKTLTVNAYVLDQLCSLEGFLLGESIVTIIEVATNVCIQVQIIDKPQPKSGESYGWMKGTFLRMAGENFEAWGGMDMRSKSSLKWDLWPLVCFQSDACLVRQFEGEDSPGSKSDLIVHWQGLIECKFSPVRPDCLWREQSFSSLNDLRTFSYLYCNQAWFCSIGL